MGFISFFFLHSYVCTKSKYNRRFGAGWLRWLWNLKLLVLFCFTCDDLVKLFSVIVFSPLQLNKHSLPEFGKDRAVSLMFLVFFLFLPLPNQDDQLFLCRVLFCICRYSKLCLCIHIISLFETFCDRKRQCLKQVVMIFWREISWIYLGRGTNVPYRELLRVYVWNGGRWGRGEGNGCPEYYSSCAIY